MTAVVGGTECTPGCAAQGNDPEHQEDEICDPTLCGTESEPDHCELDNTTPVNSDNGAAVVYVDSSQSLRDVSMFVD